jgi:hypothetical protein
MLTTFVGVQPNGRALIYADGPPLLASDLGGVSAQAGDVILQSNIAPTPGSSFMWRCIVGGAPGTWEAVAGASKSSVTSLTNAAFLANNTVPIVVVPAQGAGTMIEVISMVVEVQFATAAFAGGGAVALYYSGGSGPTLTLASATVAAAFFTGAAANQIILVAGALASAASSVILNAPVVLTNPSANFTNASGGTSTVQIRVNYRVHAGL